MAQFHKETAISLSYHTVYRALHDAGYSCKRAKKTPPVTAPSKEEKIEMVNEIISKINNLNNLDDVEIAFLDESHFTTDPYGHLAKLVRMLRSNHAIDFFRACL